MKPEEDPVNRVFVFLFISITLFFMIFTITYFINDGDIVKSDNSILISGYLNYYTYGYTDDNFIFEICVSSESGYGGEKTIYRLNPSQKDSFLRYNSVGNQVSFYASKKSVYEIRSLQDGKENECQYNGTKE